MCDNDLTLQIPEFRITIRPGSKVKLSRFDSIMWVMSHGWYTWGGNRPFCGWYMYNLEDPTDVRPLQKTDLDDIYLLEY